MNLLLWMRSFSSVVKLPANLAPSDLDSLGIHFLQTSNSAGQSNMNFNKLVHLVFVLSLLVSMQTLRLFLPFRSSTMTTSTFLFLRVIARVIHPFLYIPHLPVSAPLIFLPFPRRVLKTLILHGPVVIFRWVRGFSHVPSGLLRYAEAVSL